jgi:hypothetical protein
MSKTVNSDDLNDFFYRSGYCRYRIYFLETLYELAGFGEDGVEAEPGALVVAVLEDEEATEKDLVAFFANDRFLGFDLVQEFPFLGVDGAGEGVALDGDDFFEGVALDGWVLLLEAAVEEDEEVTDMSAADGAKAIACLYFIKNFVQ